MPHTPQADQHPTKHKATIRELWDLFACTFKVGAVTFGGGYVIIPMLQREFSEKRDYIDRHDILDIVAISQSLPGVISINACIMVGYRKGGIPGALCTSLGVVLPSFILLSIITYFYEAVASNVIVAAALQGVRAGVVALMLSSVIKLGKPILTGAWPIVLTSLAFLLSFQLGVNGIYIILGSGLLGFIVMYLLKSGSDKKPPDQKEDAA